MFHDKTELPNDKQYELNKFLDFLYQKLFLYEIILFYLVLDNDH
jgi:hypothetical protein